MMNKKKREIKSFLMVVLVVVALCQIVSAVSVGSPYSVYSPLKLHPGEEKVVRISLQNPDTSPEITVVGNLIEGSEIASFDRESYTVPYQSRDVNARLTIKIPENADIGKEYTLKYEFYQAPSEEGMVQIGTRVTTGFKVVVVEKPPEAKEEGEQQVGVLWILLAIIVIAVVVVVIYFIMRKRGSATNLPAKKPASVASSFKK